MIRTTDPKLRTQALALQPIAALLGAFFGPVLSILCSFAPARSLDSPVFNESTIAFYVASVLSLLRLPFLIWGFREDVFSDAHIEQTLEQRLHSRLAGHNTFNTWKWLMFFALTLFLYQVTNGLYNLTYQPILVDDWFFNQLYLSLFILSIIFIAIFPPVLMVILSEKFHFGDRWFLLVGLAGTFFPGLIYAYPTHKLAPIIIGGILSVPFSQLINPSCETLFSKKVGTLNASGFKVGLLTAAGSVGNTVGSVLGNIALDQYGTLLFMIWAVPCFLALLQISLFFHFLSTPTPKSTEIFLEEDHASVDTPLMQDSHRDLLSSNPGDNHFHSINISG